MAEVVHVAAASLDAERAGDLGGFALCGARVPPGLNVVTRLNLAWGDPAEHRETVNLITCQACRAALVQEALERTG